MKGDDMKNIILKFIGTGYLNTNQAYVCIYDENNNYIYTDYTYNGKLKVCLKSKRIYRIIAKTKYGVLDKTFYVNGSDVYIFAFDYSYLKVSQQRLITFYLTDYYYNLPISKGELNFG